jgi:hypothetical protein
MCYYRNNRSLGVARAQVNKYIQVNKNKNMGSIAH